jgi:small GTP-binding protein
MNHDNHLMSEAEKSVKVAASLYEMADIIDTLGEEQVIDKLSNQVRMRAASVRNDRFSIVVVGGFSKGKSTLLNAILGVDILPQKMIPSTAVITILEYAEKPSARIRYLDNQMPEERLSIEDFRQRFVLNENDSSNGKIDTDRFSQVDHAVVSYPIELCRYRVELVDSPGLKDDPVRTERTRKFLKHADAIVMVLDAQDLCDQDEREFLTTVLLPEGLTNIFFVINKWNLVEESMIRPEDIDQALADLENRIRNHLRPFCLIDGQDRSEERIFRVNALGALRARMQNPPRKALLEDSNVPQFEESLQKFLIEERGKAKNDIIRSIAKTTANEVNTFIAIQEKVAQKSIAEIESEMKELQPKLDRLRGIRAHIINFLNGQSQNLQERLGNSFYDHITKRIVPKIPDAVEECDFSNVFGWSITWKAIVDRWKDDEDKLAAQIESSLKPQVQKWLNQEFASWRTAVVKNELPAAQIDIEKYLQEEAAEYRRVLSEIEQQLGIHGNVVDVEDLVKDWLQSPDSNANDTMLDLSGIGVLGDLSWLIGGIAAEIAIEATTQLTISAFIPIVGTIFTAIRLGWRESALRKQVKAQLANGIRESLLKIANTQGTAIREQVRQNFNDLEATVTANVNEQIALIEASLQSIIDRKRTQEFSAEKLRQQLGKTNDNLQEVIQQLNKTLAITV